MFFRRIVGGSFVGQAVLALEQPTSDIRPAESFPDFNNLPPLACVLIWPVRWWLIDLAVIRFAVVNDS